jgi:hypothetical protein
VSFTWSRVPTEDLVVVSGARQGGGCPSAQGSVDVDISGDVLIWSGVAELWLFPYRVTVVAPSDPEAHLDLTEEYGADYHVHESPRVCDSAYLTREDPDA